MVGNICSKIWKTILILSCLVLMASLLACSGGESVPTKSDSRADAVAAKQEKKEKLPPVSSIKKEEGENIQITAEDLVKKLNKNNVKKNIKQFFGKYADITGEIKRVDLEKGNLEVTLDGHYDSELMYIICKINPYTPEDEASVAPGMTVTVEGQIKAMKEWPGARLGSMVRASDSEAKGQVVKPCNLK
jgi:hypothetical protein